MSFVKYTNEQELLDIINIFLKSKNTEIGDLLYDIFIKSIKYNKSIENIKLLLQDKRLDISKDEDRTITYSAQLGRIEIVKLLLIDDRVDPNRGWTLQSTVENGHTEIVELLLKDGRADPSNKNNNAIISACYNNHLDIIKMLLDDKRVDPTIYNNLPLQDVCEIGNVEVVKLLLADSRVDPTSLDNRAFQNACYNGNIDIVKLLLEDKRVVPDNKAFQNACQQGHFDIVEFLLKDVDPADKQNLAIRLATLHGHTKCVELLMLDNRVNYRDFNDGALKNAIKNKHNDIIKLLK
jgi:ankyrin repeat protein